MNEDSVEYILLQQIDKIQDVFNYSIAIEDDYVKNILEEVMCKLWSVQVKNQKIRRMLTDSLKWLKESQETDWYDTKNEQYDIKTALDLIK